ncbi:hypothetical protein [Massilia sp. METH4]|uniref:hypothetical protein n=1 Tax=Massilia sp. METH4 TaxID=3123041 RepID=UPI0030D452F9
MISSLMLAAALIPALASARQDAVAEREAYANLPVCRLGPDRRSLEIEPCRTAPAQRPMPRRPVPRQDDADRIGPPDTMPPSAAGRPVLPSATLGQRSPYPAAPVAPVPPLVNPSANPSASPPDRAITRPSPTTCVGGVCRDTNGNTFQQGGTGVTRTPAGRHCTTVGGFVRCM